MGQAWERFASSGDSTSFEVLFDALYSKYCKVAFAYLNDRHDAEEVVMDVFVGLWRSGGSLECSSSADSYLFRAVKNRCLNCIRDRKSSESLESEDPAIAKYDFDFLSERDLQMVIRDALSPLPEKCMKVYELSRGVGKSNREIAEEMSLSEKSVEAYITRALKAIKDALVRHDFEETVKFH